MMGLLSNSPSRRTATVDCDDSSDGMRQVYDICQYVILLGLFEKPFVEIDQVESFRSSGQCGV